MRLTKTICQRATYQGSGNQRCVLWETELPGFGLRIYPSGRKAFVVSYRAGRRSRLMVIGSFGLLTVQEARERARKALVAVRDGEDPLATRQQAPGETVAAFCQVYIERHAKPRKKTWAEDERRIEFHILPALGRRTLGEVQRADVAALHSRLVGAPYEANRVVSLLRTIFSCALKWGFLPDGHRNPADGLDMFKERSRDRWVTPQELPGLLKAIEAEESLYVRSALLLLLLTGCRKSEILQAKWEDVDLDRSELRLRDAKTGTRYVPLSAPALEIIRSLPRQLGNPYLLPSMVKAKGHLTSFDRPWARIRKAAGCPDVRIHDLRRTVGSWLATSGHSLPAIGKVLGHTKPGTTAVYARLAEDVAQKALEEHGARILEAAGRFSEAS